MAKTYRRISLLAAGAIALPCASYYGFLMGPAASQTDLDQQLAAELQRIGFTGRTQESLEQRLGRPINKDIEEIGRFLFFDKIQGLHGDNSCAGCHAPAAGFGDFKSIAIGVDNNGIVGPGRKGPRNQRRTPMVLNNAFYPKLMWNGRFLAPTGDPFDNSQGFGFPDPEGKFRFPADDPNIKVLLAAQGHIPGTELPELAGFTGTAGTWFVTQRFFGPATMQPMVAGERRPLFQVFPPAGAQLMAADNGAVPPSGEPTNDIFDDGVGVSIPLPRPMPDGTRNEPIRDIIQNRIDSSKAYRDLFGKVYPAVAAGQRITFSMIGQALSEFQVGLTFADAPLDKFARGDRSAMSPEQKRGALLFFGKAGCVSCHATAGQSNEMFSDFEMRNIGVPQIAPKFGVGTGNLKFRKADGQFSVSGNYDFGLADIRSQGTPEFDSAKFKFRTSPLRNIHLQPTFFHNGSFTRLEDAIRHHLDPVASARSYDAARAGVEEDLRNNTADPTPVLADLDDLIKRPISLSDQEFTDLVTFVREGLADPRATPENLAKLKPDSVPSGHPLQIFEKP